MKHAPRVWYDKINNFFLQLGFKHCELDHSIYVLQVNVVKVYIFLYEDDLIITRNKSDSIYGLKVRLTNIFQMSNLGLLHFFLDIQVMQLDYCWHTVIRP